MCLATLDDVHVVTGGFNGVGATVAESYERERERLRKTCHLWHVLPVRDEQVRVCQLSWPIAIRVLSSR